MNKFKLTNINCLTYSELYESINELEKAKLDLYTKLSKLNYLNDKIGKSEVLKQINVIDFYLHLYLGEMAIKEEFVFNIFGTPDNTFDMCLN